MPGDRSFGESGINDKLELSIEALVWHLFPILDVELLSLLDEIEPPKGVNILSYRGSHDVVLRNLGFECLRRPLSATSLGLNKSRWPTLASASLELTVDDKGRRNRRRCGLNTLTSLSLSVKDESPRDGIRNLPSSETFLLGFIETVSMF